MGAGEESQIERCIFIRKMERKVMAGPVMAGVYWQVPKLVKEKEVTKRDRYR